MTLWPFGKDANAAQQNSQDVLATLLVMAWTVEARDPYTGGHLWRVSRMAEVLARRAGLSGIDVSRVAIGGFLHDLGKVMDIPATPWTAHATLPGGDLRFTHPLRRPVVPAPAP